MSILVEGCCIYADVFRCVLHRVSETFRSRSHERDAVLMRLPLTWALSPYALVLIRRTLFVLVSAFFVSRRACREEEEEEEARTGQRRRGHRLTF